jgi:hypothetical protein
VPDLVSKNKLKEKKRDEHVAQWQSTYLACIRPH